ncbi:MAG TPA: FAD-dependent oxidoreductase [Candidatus Saccharimonadales bacterium]|jgi:glycerol-3-phosphate dehydrogenase
MATSDKKGKITPRIVIIGGGATGTGIARDAAARGYDVVLVDGGELGSGTSGNFHGILHSGARYAVSDPAVAAECFQENQLLRRLIPSAITDTGGMFVALTDEEVAHSHAIMHACAQSGIEVKSLTLEQALHAEPHLSKSLKAAFTVPDGFIDGVELLRLNRIAAVEADMPATFLTNHVVTGFKKSHNSISSVILRDIGADTQELVACDYVVNAAGVWADRIAEMVGLEIPMIYDKGTMVMFEREYNKAVLNRCRPESDGDLLAPHAGQSIMGTTSRVIANPDNCEPTPEEISLLVREGVTMIPALKNAMIRFAYAGVRPLMDKHDTRNNRSSRSISRSYDVLDHAEQGIDNFVSIVGGKVTLSRRMAEAVVNLIDSKSSEQATVPR